MRRTHGVVSPGLHQVLAFCEEEPVERVYLEEVARQGAGRFVGVSSNGTLEAVCHLGANVVPSGSGCAALAREVVRMPGRMIIGKEEAVDELWAAAAGFMPRPRLDRPGQPVYVLDHVPAPAGTALRLATRGDLGLLLAACAQMHEEEMGENPLERDPSGFRRRTKSQIDRQRSWLWEEDGTILFKAEASAWTPHAVQLQQVWVDPSARGRGYAKSGMADLCRLLLESVPRVCLFVRTDNVPAIRVYESIGMSRAMTYRSLVF
jgi:ribosomal protein S18 acetylase RimI-like enzyme